MMTFQIRDNVINDGIICEGKPQNEPVDVITRFPLLNYYFFYNQMVYPCMMIIRRIS